MRAIVAGTMIKVGEDEYKIKRINSIDGDMILYDVSGDGPKQLMSSRVELLGIDDPEITKELIPLWCYRFEFDKKLHERPAWGFRTPNGRIIIFCPNVRAIIEPMDLDRTVGSKFDLYCTTRDMETARRTIETAMAERLA